ncbi:MAG TPA: hypothetical protein VMT53_08775 [Terriglobales bacterium]|nr:hypothetical protein [Terriglobales bacterium]
MPEIENLQDSIQHCFELAKRSDFLDEDIALEAFELLTSNNYDHIAAHALGVSLEEARWTWIDLRTGVRESGNTFNARSIE